MAPVLIVLRATFVAVPAFNRVDPVSSSGPTASVITRSTSLLVAGVGDPGWSASTPPATVGLHVSKIVSALNDFALASAPTTKGVRPLAVIPITTSEPFILRSSKANAPAIF